MGGQPVIQGGMSAAEYSKILADQQKWADQAEKDREIRVREYERERMANEKSALLEQKQLEEMSIQSQKEAEEEIADEIKAQEEDALTSEIPRLGSNFISSLYQGLINSSDRYING